MIFDPRWYLVDAAGQVIGRLASRIASQLLGKHYPTYSPHLDNADQVVVINAEKVLATGKKERQKVYRRHSGYPGGLKEATLGSVRQSHPERILVHAVSGMLPKNKLRSRRLKRLHVVVGSQHPYGEHFA